MSLLAIDFNFNIAAASRNMVDLFFQFRLGTGHFLLHLLHPLHHLVHITGAAGALGFLLSYWFSFLVVILW